MIRDNAPSRAPHGTVMVLLARQKRVRHLAVWGVGGHGVTPLCGNRGDLPVFGNFNDYDGIPCCRKCAAEAELLHVAAVIAGGSDDVG